MDRADQFDLRLCDLLRLLCLPRAPQRFHTGWFVESLATQTLGDLRHPNQGKSAQEPAQLALLLTTSAIVAVGFALPYSAVGRWLGFQPLPTAYFLYVGVASCSYLLLVEFVKRKLMRRAYQ